MTNDTSVGHKRSIKIFVLFVFVATESVIIKSSAFSNDCTCSLNKLSLQNISIHCLQLSQVLLQKIWKKRIQSMEPKHQFSAFTSISDVCGAIGQSCVSRCLFRPDKVDANRINYCVKFFPQEEEKRLKMLIYLLWIKNSVLIHIYSAFEFKR